MSKRIAALCLLFMLLTSAMADSCPKGTFSFVHSCLKCSSGCEECASMFHCNRCASDYTIDSKFSDWRTCSLKTSYILKKLMAWGLLIGALCLVIVCCRKACRRRSLEEASNPMMQQGLGLTPFAQQQFGPGLYQQSVQYYQYPARCPSQLSHIHGYPLPPLPQQYLPQPLAFHPQPQPLIHSYPTPPDLQPPVEEPRHAGTDYPAAGN